MKRPDIVLLSTAEWDFPFWTNKQHVACELAKRGHRTFYIESLGLRRPSVNARDVRRIFRRIAKALRGPRQVRDNLWVWSPLVLPFQGSWVIRTLNRTLLRATLALHLRRLGFSRDILWTYNPMTTCFFNVRRWRQVVYHCVDDIAAQPGMPAEAIEAGDEQLTKASDIVFTTAPSLAEARRSLNPRTHYLPNVADYEHFAQAREPVVKVPDDLLEIPTPRLGFVGAVSGYKVDFGLVRSLASRRPEWSFVLIGEVGVGDPGTDPDLLEGLPNLHLLGPRPYRELPLYMKGFDVGLLPNLLNQYTTSMFPMKFFEYLAAGLPVVSVDLPAIRDFREVVSIGVDLQSFESAIDRVLQGSGPDSVAALRVAQLHTYKVRTDKMMHLLQNPGHGPTVAVNTNTTESQPPVHASPQGAPVSAP